MSTNLWLALIYGKTDVTTRNVVLGLFPSFEVAKQLSVVLYNRRVAPLIVPSHSDWFPSLINGNMFYYAGARLLIIRADEETELRYNLPYIFGPI